MTARGLAIAAILRTVFEQLTGLDRTAPADVDQIVMHVIAHMRSWPPVAVAPLGTLSPPTDPAAIRDPRGPR